MISEILHKHKDDINSIFWTHRNMLPTDSLRKDIMQKISGLIKMKMEDATTPEDLDEGHIIYAVHMPDGNLEMVKIRFII